jgi:hypothetical protein
MRWLTQSTSSSLPIDRPPVAASGLPKQGSHRQSTRDEPTEPSPHHTTPRIIVSTTNKWNAHAENASHGQQIPVWRDRYGRAHLGVTAQPTTRNPDGADAVEAHP